MKKTGANSGYHYFAGRLQLPLTGHRDDSPYHPEVGKYSSGRAVNFIELLNYRVGAGDSDLEAHLRNTTRMLLLFPYCRWLTFD